MSEALIEQAASRLFAGNVNAGLIARFELGEWPQDLWKLTLKSGLPLTLATEASGGIGASWSEAYPILRGLGYWHVPLPLAETMIAASVLSHAGLEVPAGPIAIVDEEEGAGVNIEGGAVGAVRSVPWALCCNRLLLSTGREMALIDIADRAVAHVGTRRNAAGEPDDAVQFEHAPIVARAPWPWPSRARPLRAYTALAKSAMMVGAMEWLLEQSVQYAQDRVQFGRPIGRNQAIQQALALMAGDVVAARTATVAACARVPASLPSDWDSMLFHVAVAKIRAGEAAARAAATAHQVHGAIGFTREHSLHLGTRRLWAWREAAGSEAWWSARLGAAAIAARAAGFWSGITSGSFGLPSAHEAREEAVPRTATQEALR